MPSILNSHDIFRVHRVGEQGSCYSPKHLRVRETMVGNCFEESDSHGSNQNQSLEPESKYWDCTMKHHGQKSDFINKKTSFPQKYVNRARSYVTDIPAA